MYLKVTYLRDTKRIGKIPNMKMIKDIYILI